MRINPFSEKETLAEIERMIVDLKQNGMYGDQLDVLKSVAKNMRARLPEAATQTIETIDKKIAYVLNHKTSDGYDDAALAHLGGYVLGLWPIIRIALVDRAKAEKESA